MKKLFYFGFVASVAVLLIAYFMNVKSVQERLAAKLAVSSLNEIKISFKKKEFKKISDQRDSILANPKSHVWFRSPNEKKVEVKAKVKHEGKKFKAKIKLAGHYIDHWEKETVSYKVKLKKGGKLNGSSKFNLINPRSRHYLVDWFAAKCADKLGLKTLHTEFLNVRMNGGDYIYYFEEMFDQNFVKKMKISNGFIFNEVRFQNQVHLNFEDRKNCNPVLVNNFKNDYDSIVSGSYDIMDRIDYKQMAKYYALADLFHSDHQLITVNSRYVYDDSTKLFSPVGREYWLANEVDGVPLLIDKVKNDSVLLYGNIPTALFKSEEFKQMYFNELKNIAKDDFLSGVIGDTKEQIDQAKKIFWRELAWGENLVDFELLKRNQKLIIQKMESRQIE